MKRLAKKEDLCTACHACEDACSKLYFKEVNSLKASLRIKVNDDESKTIITCTQCGRCAEVCPVEAIYQDKKGIYRIRKKDCVGCLMCVAACPENAMFQHDALLEPFKCVACGICVKECPTGAIFIEEF
ncbi:Ion-translocating oxidoreductase complex subunit B [Candidatus Lokiarchaeum ossiferum]|uniref:Ferredoxin n=1 Tax=Candidatus Lokiarchaeum ossiferum TaxID=2951803 RepID=A0ABY6HLN0_9ARCH|nr:Ion-translocating oxidoreductase complex subunit B [Candidatus Lokiarchaeum sp. B-35]